jgi:hypothetical protein
MKPRAPLKLTRTADLGPAKRPGPRPWEAEEQTAFDDDPENKTPVVPAPTLWMLAHSGASWYSRYRGFLIGTFGTLVVLGGVLVGLRAYSRGLLGGSPTRLLSAAPPAAPPRPVVVPVASAAARAITPPAAAAAPAAPAVPAVPDTIVLSVAVSPANAVILIDGDPVPSNPFLSRFPRGVATHRVRALAPGFKTKERLVSFADNVMLDLSLSPLPPEPPPAHSRERSKRREPPPRPAPPPPVAPAPVAAPAPAPAATAEASVRPESDKPRRRRIDANDPYAEDRR